MQNFSFKNFLFLFLAVLVLMAIVSASRYFDYSYFEGKKVVFFGDSLTKGLGASAGNDFVSLLAKEIPIQAFNLGKIGDTTSLALERIGDILKINPEVAVIWLGGNDFLQEMPPEITESNLKEIIKKLREENIRVVLVGLNSLELFSQERIFYKIATEMNVVSFVPDAGGGILGNSSLTIDGMHPNGEGHQIIAQRLLPAIKKALLVK